MMNICENGFSDVFHHSWKRSVQNPIKIHKNLTGPFPAGGIFMCKMHMIYIWIIESHTYVRSRELLENPASSYLIRALCDVAGRYFMMVNETDRYVAYCRRVDTPPSIFLEDGTSWFLLGAAATADSLPDVTCTDSEDAGNMKDPTHDFDTKVTPYLDTAGNYYATWYADLVHYRS